MAGIQRRLGPWKHQPHQHIEQVMPVALAALQFAAFMNADFVRQLSARRNQPQRHPRCDADAGIIKQALQQGEIGPVEPLIFAAVSRMNCSGARSAVTEFR
jgi:hypothetical protein